MLWGWRGCREKCVRGERPEGALGDRSVLPLRARLVYCYYLHHLPGGGVAVGGQAMRRRWSRSRRSAVCRVQHSPVVR